MYQGKTVLCLLKGVKVNKPEYIIYWNIVQIHSSFQYVLPYFAMQLSRLLYNLKEPPAVVSEFVDRGRDTCAFE